MIITPNHVEFRDNHGDMIHLIRAGTALNIPSSQLEHQAHTAYDNGPAIAHATSALSPYQSGYEHGISDAKNTGNETSYIVQQGKGFAFHTQEFNQGYIDGFCSILGHGAGSDADQATFECSIDSSAARNSSHSS